MEKKTNKNRATWYKLDLSANVYPTLQRKNFSSVYRITIIMKEEVDPPLLQKAVDLARFLFVFFSIGLL